jgi:predicted ATPase/class 3 adenylate cyclase
MASVELPTGTITFLFTDVESSTQLFEQAPERAQEALARHDAIVERDAAAFDGLVVKPRGEGDSRFVVFAQATAAAAAAVRIQQDLYAESWETPWPLKVRIALHTGEADLRQGDYYGTDVNRCARLRGIGHGGQVLLSEATWVLVQDDLPPEVTAQDEGQHRLKDLSRPEHVYQLIIPDLPQDFPPLRSLGIFPTNLPVQLTEFIGRQEASKATRKSLQAGRLLTIVGPGGIGKSRLAIEVAADLAEQFRHGVFFVPLAPLTDDQYIVTTINDSIGLRSPAGRDLRKAMLDYLRHKQLLLIMDNFEHMLAGADIVTDILQEAPGVKILSTSRERLNLSDEAVYMLSGLDYPADPRLPGQEAARFGAVQLLLHRARLVRPGLEVEEPELDQVARICRLVQGMPLALVLAAGWLELLTFEEVADEITASLDILESQARDMPERQRSVRAAFEYSWGRLEAGDQGAFSRLAVFRGGFSRQAAQEVAGAGLRTLRNLAKKSLITTDGTDRYAIHELLRQFAEEKLEAAGQAGGIRDAHKLYYLEAVAQRETDLKGRRQLEALEEIEIDLDNVRAAWTWSLEQGDESVIDRAQESLSLFFYMRFQNQEGWLLFRQALQELAADKPLSDDSRRIWGRLTARSGLLQAQFAESAPEIEEAIKKSLAITEANADQAEIAYSYLALGHYYSRLTGDFSQALDYFLQALERYQALADLYFVAHLLHRVGYCHGFITGIDEYMRYTRQSLELARQIGDLSDEAYAIGNLGWGSFWSGDYDGAEGYAREAIALCQRMGERGTLGHWMILLGLCHVLNGRLEEAQEPLAEGVEIAEDIVYPLSQAYGLAVMSLQASLAGDYELGRRLAGESQERHTNLFGEFLGHWAQATALVGIGETEQAWQHSLSGLEFFANWGWDSRTTWMLPVVGIVLARQGQPERAVEMLSLYFNHPNRPIGFAEGWPLLGEWQVRLKENLGADKYRAAWERGRDMDLTTTVEALMIEGKEAP